MIVSRKRETKRNLANRDGISNFEKFTSTSLWSEKSSGKVNVF